MQPVSFKDTEKQEQRARSEQAARDQRIARDRQNLPQGGGKGKQKKEVT